MFPELKYNMFKAEKGFVFYADIYKEYILEQ